MIVFVTKRKIGHLSVRRRDSVWPYSTCGEDLTALAQKRIAHNISQRGVGCLVDIHVRCAFPGFPVDDMLEISVVSGIHNLSMLEAPPPLFIQRVAGKRAKLKLTSNLSAHHARRNEEMLLYTRRFSGLPSRSQPRGKVL